MKIAIIGAGIAGLACALECEKLGVYPDVFERDKSVGWIWPSMSFWPRVYYNYLGDPLEYLKKNYDIDLSPINECNNVIMKSPNKTLSIDGKLGYFLERGRDADSKENQLLRKLKKTAIHYNSPADYKELAKKYDWVVVTTGNDAMSKELGLWQEEGTVNIMAGVVLGRFEPTSAAIYFNTEYAGTGYARITPFSSTRAMIGLYDIGHDIFDLYRLYQKFLQYEGLENLEFIYSLILPTFSIGKCKSSKISNILVAGRAAGLVESSIGVGSVECMSSGVLAARAIIQDLDYEELIKPFKTHLENLSAYRKIINGFDNSDFDRIVQILDTPGIKQIVYNTGLNFSDMAGSILKVFNQKD